MPSEYRGPIQARNTRKLRRRRPMSPSAIAATKSAASEPAAPATSRAMKMRVYRLGRHGPTIRIVQKADESPDWMRYVYGSVK